MHQRLTGIGIVSSCTRGAEHQRCNDHHPLSPATNTHRTIVTKIGLNCNKLLRSAAPVIICPSWQLESSLGLLSTPTFHLSSERLNRNQGCEVTQTCDVQLPGKGEPRNEQRIRTGRTRQVR